MVDLKDISIQEIKAVAVVLKGLKKNWAVELLELMKEEDEEMNLMCIYNVVSNRRKHQQHRRLFIKHADILLKKLGKEQNKSIATVEAILANNSKEKKEPIEDKKPWFKS